MTQEQALEQIKKRGEELAAKSLCDGAAFSIRLYQPIRVIHWRYYMDDEDSVALCNPSDESAADALRALGWEITDATPEDYQHEGVPPLIVVQDIVIDRIPWGYDNYKEPAS